MQNTISNKYNSNNLEELKDNADDIYKKGILSSLREELNDKIEHTKDYLCTSSFNFKPIECLKTGYIYI